MHDGSAAPIHDAELAALEPILQRFAVRAVRDTDVARDLVQEALVSALAQRASFAGRSSLRTWVIGILSHKVTDHFRRRSTRPERDDGDDADLLRAPSPDDVERVVAARQELAAVEAALAGLPDLERLALLMVDVEGVERQDCCNALDVSATHLRVLLHRGRNRLRGMLQHDR